MNATVLAEPRKLNAMYVVILLISLVCVGLAGYLWYTSGKQNNEQISKFDFMIKDLQKQIDEQRHQLEVKDNKIAIATGQLTSAAQEKSMLLSELEALKTQLKADPNKPQLVSASAKEATEVLQVMKSMVEKATAIVKFDTNSYHVKQQYLNDLHTISDLIQRKRTVLVLEGQADKTGDPEYNKWLSKMRAEAVKVEVLKMAGDKQPCNVISIGVGSEKSSNLSNADARRVIVTGIEDCKDYLNK